MRLEPLHCAKGTLLGEKGMVRERRKKGVMKLSQTW